MDSVLTQILLQVALILLNAIFACAEIAVLSFNEAKLEQLAESGNKKAKRLQKLTLQPAKFLATIQVAITLSGFLGSAFAAENFSDLLVGWVASWSKDAIPLAVLDKISVVVITLVLSYFTLVLGELVPKRLAMKKAEKLALALSSIINFISVAFAPIVWFLTVSTNGILRLFGIDPHEKEDSVTEEEIKLMVDAGSETGAIDREEREIIQNVFEFDDISADEIATKRIDVEVLWLDGTPEEWHETIKEGKFTRYPICDGSKDNVVAILNTRYYHRLKDKSRESVMENATRPPYFVPENVKADVLFRNMKKNKDYYAVVLDEYGGMNGIVTMTDLIECIIGDFNYGDDEVSEEDADITALEDGSWKVYGNTPIKDVEEALGLQLDDEFCDTFAGYLLGLLGTIPEDGSETVVENEEMLVNIVEVKDHRIEKTIVTVKPKEEASEEDGEE